MKPEPERTAPAASEGLVLTSEEISTLVRARQILKRHALAAGYSVKDVSEWAGVSRKTAYAREAHERQQLATERAEYEALRREVQTLRQQCELKDETVRRQERDIDALELTKRAYQELKKTAEQESRRAKHHR